MLSVGALAVTLAVVLGALQQRREHPGPATPAPPAAPRETLPDAVSVLREWDSRRAAAWENGDGGGLAELYVPGSRAGAADVALLRGYAERGFRVRGLAMQLLEVDVRRQTPTALRLLVTDRLAGAVAVRGRTRVSLPSDAPSRREVTLRLVDGSWLVDRVRDR